MGNKSNKEGVLYNGGYGFRVLKVNPASPMGNMKIEPFLDFLVTITAVSTGESPSPLTPQTFFELLQRQEGRETELGIFNVRTSHLRFVRIVPNKNWEGADGLLGLMIRFEEYSKAQEKTFKVLKVKADSPALQAGLEEEDDFVLGFTHYNHKDFDDFINILRNLENSEVNTVELAVFNKRSSQIRFLYLTPDRNWGGEGTIGCEFGGGLLNQIPKMTYDISQNEDLTLMSSAQNPINTVTIDNPLSMMGGMNAMLGGMNANLGVQEPAAKLSSPEVTESKPEAKATEENESDDDESLVQKQEPPKNVFKEEFVMPKPLTEQEILQQTGVYNMIMNKRQHMAKKGPGVGGAIVPPKNPFSVNKNSKAESKAGAPGNTQAAVAAEKTLGKQQGFEVEFVGKPRFEVQEPGENAEENSKHEEEGNPETSDNNSFLNSLSNHFEEMSINHSSTLEGASGSIATSQPQGVANSQIAQDSKSLNPQDSLPDRDKQARKDSRPKMTMKYSFFCQKLNGDYVVNSEDLFQTDITL